VIPRSPLELERLALRIEQLQVLSTHDWSSSDDLDIRRMLPAPRNPRSFPDPADLRELALRWRSGQDVEDEVKELGPLWTWWQRQALNLEQLAAQNRTPHHRVMRDLRRGRLPRGPEGLLLLATILGATKVATGRDEDE